VFTSVLAQCNYIQVKKIKKLIKSNLMSFYNLELIQSKLIRNDNQDLNKSRLV